MKDSPAPIALFVFNRPWHTRQTIQALISNELASSSSLFIFADGPRSDVDRNAVQEVRAYLRTITGFRSITIVEQDRNRGLAQSVIAGVTDSINRYGRVIVLEDDLIVSPHFLEYMNESLNRYERHPAVMQVSGHMFPVSLRVETDSLFLPFTTSWGWATWKRAWDSFDADMSGYAQLRANRSLKRRFDLEGAYPYFEMLEKQLESRLDSWAIRWYLSVFMLSGLTLYPKKTLVSNIGFDGTGTHSPVRSDRHTTDEADFQVKTWPDSLHVSEAAFEDVQQYLAQEKHSVLSRYRKLMEVVYVLYRRFF